MRYFFIAFQFLTIVPLPFRPRCEEEDLGRSMAFFPLVGLVLGLLLVGLDMLLSLRLPPMVVDLLLVTVLTVVTGGLHLDGLADVCDGLAARGPRERFLEVMKDPRTGAVGAAGVTLSLLLKFVALTAIPAEIRREALLFFPLVGRFSQVQMTVGAQRARSDGLGAAFIGGVGVLQMVLAEITVLAAAYLFFGMKGLYIFVLIYLATWRLKVWFHNRLGGVTGDVIGCASELNEILCLLLVAAFFGVTH